MCGVDRFIRQVWGLVHECLVHVVVVRVVVVEAWRQESVGELGGQLCNLMPGEVLRLAEQPLALNERVVVGFGVKSLVQTVDWVDAAWL